MTRYSKCTEDRSFDTYREMARDGLFSIWESDFIELLGTGFDDTTIAIFMKKVAPGYVYKEHNGILYVYDHKYFTDDYLEYLPDVPFEEFELEPMSPLFVCTKVPNDGNLVINEGVDIMLTDEALKSIKSIDTTTATGINYLFCGCTFQGEYDFGENFVPVDGIDAVCCFAGAIFKEPTVFKTHADFDCNKADGFFMGAKFEYANLDIETFPHVSQSNTAYFALYGVDAPLDCNLIENFVIGDQFIPLHWIYSRDVYVTSTPYLQFWYTGQGLDNQSDAIKERVREVYRRREELLSIYNLDNKVIFPLQSTYKNKDTNKSTL